MFGEQVVSRVVRGNFEEIVLLGDFIGAVRSEHLADVEHIWSRDGIAVHIVHFVLWNAKLLQRS